MPALIESGINIPKHPRGRPTAAAKLELQTRIQGIYEFIIEADKTLGFRPGARGWCYLLENARLIDKSELDWVEGVISDGRKSGALPLDICSEDAKREWHNVEDLDCEDAADEAGRIVETFKGWITRYQPYSFWKGKSHYIQLLVEKIDLRELFLPVCKRWHIPICNGGGWSDINSRCKLMERFRDNLEEGQIPVVLYCGDFDPAGLRISGFLRENIDQLSAAVGWSPDNLIVDRFGLNFDFIEANGLTWIDNLQTSGQGAVNDLSDPHHKHHSFAYVQDYLARYGARKVEANALVTRAEAGRELCEAAILKYMVDPTLPEQFTDELQPDRDDLRDELKSALADYLEAT